MIEGAGDDESDRLLGWTDPADDIDPRDPLNDDRPEPTSWHHDPDATEPTVGAAVTGPAVTELDDTELDVSELDDAGLIDRIIHTEAEIALAQSRQVTAMAELMTRREHADRRAAGGDGSGREIATTVDEIAMALTIPRVTAGHRTELACALVSRLPATLAALSAGQLDLARARVIAEGTRRLTDGHAALVETVVLDDARRMTCGRLRPRVAKAAASIEPETIEDDHADALTRRRVTRMVLEDGMAGIWAVLPADAAAEVWAMLNTLSEAAHTPGDSRTADQRRADVLTDLAHGYLTGRLRFRLTPDQLDHTHPTTTTTGTGTGTPAAGDSTPAAGAADPAGDDLPAWLTTAAQHPTSTSTGSGGGGSGHDCTCRTGGPPAGPPGRAGRIPRWAQVQILIPATLLEGTPSPPAELLGHGPIPTSMALRLARDADWRRLVYDPHTGRALALSSTAHDPPKALREFLHARDPHCTAPGCRNPRTDLDHRTPHHHGGATDDINLTAPCRHHHQVKQHPDWRVARGDDGLETWTTPTGHTYHQIIHDHRPDTGLINPQAAQQHSSMPDDEPPPF